MHKKLLSIKQVAELCNISVATVNYYTNMGLFRVSDRRGNKRLYNQDEVTEKFNRIRELRKQGYSLALIQNQMLNGNSEINGGKGP